MFESIDDVPSTHLIFFMPYLLKLELCPEIMIGRHIGFKCDTENWIRATHKIIFDRCQKDEAYAREIIVNTILPAFPELEDALLLKDVDKKSFEIYNEEFLDHPRGFERARAVLCIFDVKTALPSLKEGGFGDSFKDFPEIGNDPLDIICQRSNVFLRLIRGCSTGDPSYWYLELLKSCVGHPKSFALAVFLDLKAAKLIQTYNAYLANLNMKASSELLPEFIDESFVPTEPRPQQEFDGIPPIERCQSQTYDIRDYQRELSRSAKKGISTIICAPTGSGKTVVAMDIIINHLNKHIDKFTVGRVVFFAPTVPLVHQQAEGLERLCGSFFTIKRLTGRERCVMRPNEYLDILAGDIVVMTPQIFLNMIRACVKTEKLYFSDFTLMIFDECHHCGREHAYNGIMNEFREFKGPVPQVVGLTASVGVDNAIMDAEHTVQYIIDMCARLNAETITSIRQRNNLEQLLEHVPKPVDEFVIAEPPKIDDFAHHIALIADDIQAEIKPELNDLVKLNVAFKDFLDLPKERNPALKVRNGSSKLSVAYRGALIRLRDLLKSVGASFSTLKEFISNCIDLLDVIYFTLCYNELFPSERALYYIEGRLDEIITTSQKLKDAKYNSKLDKIRLNFAEGVKTAREYVNDNEKPILTKLVEIIVKQFRENPDSKVVVFLQLRIGSIFLHDHLSRHKDIVETVGPDTTAYIVSANQTSRKYGQTAIEQKAALKAFKDGSKKILVSTAVGNEGLDIAECNLVIKYNDVSSEKVFIQRRGRARAKNSKSIMLALSSQAERKEIGNMKREKLMNLCVEHLQRVTPEEIKKRIDASKNKLMEGLRKKRAEEELRRAHNTDVYDVQCAVCETYICKSNDIKKYQSFYMVCNDQCWKNTRVVARDKRTDKVYVSESQTCGNWECSCNRQLGVVIKYAGAFFPTLAHDAFIPVLDGQRLDDWNTKQRWADIDKKFRVAPLQSIDVRKMALALSKHASQKEAIMECYAKTAAQGVDDETEMFEKNGPRAEANKLID